MACLGKLYDSDLWAEVLFSPFSFVLPVLGSYAAVRQISRCLWSHFSPHAIKTRYRVQDKRGGGGVGPPSSLQMLHSFPIKEIWKCFKNIHYSERTKITLLLPSLSLAVCGSLSCFSPFHTSERTHSVKLGDIFWGLWGARHGVPWIPYWRVPRPRVSSSRGRIGGTGERRSRAGTRTHGWLPPPYHQNMMSPTSYHPNCPT